MEELEEEEVLPEVVLALVLVLKDGRRASVIRVDRPRSPAG